MKTKIQELKQAGLVANFEISWKDIYKYLGKAKKSIMVAEKNIVIDSETAYILLYQAMLEAGRSFMFLYKLRPVNGQQHKTVVSFCTWVLGDKFREVTQNFDEMRKKRNKFIYDIYEVEISLSELNYLFKEAKKFIYIIEKIIKQKNPQQELL
ncbi:MAG: hypothetical protein ABIJ91_04300 [Candidatus Kuenenbacteria bacterium]